MTTLELLTYYLNCYFTEHEPEKILSIVTEDIHCYGFAEDRVIENLDQARAMLATAAYRTFMEYSLTLLEQQPLTEDTAELCYALTHQGVSVTYRLTGVSRMTPQGRKLALLHFSMVNPRQKLSMYSDLAHEKQVEKALELLKASIPGGIMGGYLEPGFPFYCINENMLRYLGYCCEEDFIADIDGLIDHCIHPEDMEQVDRTVDEQIAASGEYQVEYRMRKKDGSYIWVHDIGQRIVAEDGRAAILSACYDITAEKEHLRLLDRLVNNADGGMALYRVEADGQLRLLYAGEGVGRLIGCTAADYEKPCGVDALHMVFSEDRPAVLAALLETAQHGKVPSLTFRVPDVGGSYRWISGLFSRFGEDGGRPVVHAVFTPVSLQYDLQLQALNQNDTGVCIIDLDNDELYYANNAAFRLHGATPCDYTGKTCCEAFYGTGKHCHTCWRSDLTDGQGRALTHCGGKTLSVFCETRVWSGHRVAVVYQRDITEQLLLQQRLLQEERMLQAACEYAHIWVGVYETEQNRLHCFQQMQTDFSLPEYLENFPEAWVEHGFVLPDYVALYRENMERLRQGGNHVEFEIKYRHPDNSTHWARYRLHRLEDSPAYIAFTAQLIDDEKYLESRIELEEKQQNEGGANLLAHFITNLTQDQPLAHTYRFAERPELLCWQSIETQLARTLPYIVSPEDRAQFSRLHDSHWLTELFANGKTSETLDYRRIFPDGKIMWVRSVLHLLQDPKTGDILNYEYLYDIHRQTTSEELMTAVIAFGFELCASLMVDTDQITILHAGPHGQNHFEITNYTEQVAAYAQTVLAEDRAAYLAACTPANIAKNLRQNEHFEMMHRTRENGVIRYKKDQFYTYARDRAFCLLVRSDVTDIVLQEQKKRAELQKALESAEAATLAKSEFLSRMSHEIRTPMNAIIGMTAIAKDSRGDAAQIEDCLDKIDLSSHFLLTLINDILEMSRIESGRIEVKQQEFSLPILIESIRTVVEPLALRGGIHYEFVNDTEADARYLGDSVRIQQVLVNLLSNAIKFTKPGGQVHFGVEAQPLDETHTMFRFTVSDTGIGMSEAFLKKMYAPFTQEDGSNTSQFGGSGLGLAISKSLVQAMGGAITVESTVGVGSCFTVTLPLSRLRTTASLPVTEAQKPQGDYAILQGRHILMAEDHPLNVMVACKLLERKGVAVTVAENGSAAVEIFRRTAPGRFDAVLMDIRMPVMDGLDAARAIRALPRADASSIPIIAMTANAMEEDRKNSRDAGMDAHLAKPFEPSQLYSVLAGQIQKANAKK